MKHFARPAELAALVSQPLADSDWIAVDPQHIDAFAEATEDRQWIHTTPGARGCRPIRHHKGGVKPVCVAELVTRQHI